MGKVFQAEARKAEGSVGYVGVKCMVEGCKKCLAGGIDCKKTEC